MSDMPTVSIIEALEDQLRRSMEGEAWHGPSVREALDGIKAGDAAHHPIPGAHSCWELVLHLCGSYQLVLRWLDGNAAPFLPQEDWPAVPAPTNKNWQQDVASLHALNARLRAAVRRFIPNVSSSRSFQTQRIPGSRSSLGSRNMTCIMPGRLCCSSVRSGLTTM